MAERSVCIRVCKHGCDVKMFCFSRANHTSTNLKKAVEFKTRQVYFIYPFLPRLKLGKHLFAKQELITLARLRVQDLQVVRISLFITAITKSFAFISGKLFYKSNRKNSKTLEKLGEFSTVMQTHDFVSRLRTI